MYRYVIRPILFLFSPELIHHIIFFILKTTFNIPGFAWLLRKFFIIGDDKLAIEVAGLKFRNRVGIAAGFDKNALLFGELANFGFSFVEVGTITPEPQPGNTKPRSFRLVKDDALINRMGFNNGGVEKAVSKLKKRKGGIIVGGNIGKNTGTANEDAYKDYEICFIKLYDHVDYIAVNVSCPNINNLTELQDPASLEKIIRRLTDIRKGQKSYKPVMLKISPDLNQGALDEILEICIKYGIDAIIATNTTLERKGLRTSKGRVEKIGSGGLSGKPLAEISTEVIRYINTKTGGRLPVIGVGGIMSPGDAIEKIKAGASLVQVYTGFIYEGPFLAKRINRAILEIYR